MKSKAVKKRVAVFDIDGTIFRSSLQRELIMSLVKYGVFPPIVRKELEHDYFAWVNRQGNYEDYIMRVVRSYERRIGAVAVDDVRHVARLVIEQQKSRVYTFTRDLIKNLKKQGYYLLAISGSPIEIVKEFNRFYHFDAVVGMVFEVKAGRYTGQVLEIPIHDKKGVLEQYVTQHKLSLRGSVGVGDTESDVGFLELVTRPVCFNPNSNLYRIARRRGWQVVVERKDVIYRF
jgi:HAD superfamily hydrolase (TIGR01490 family)